MVARLRITNGEAAASQKAWFSDTDEVEAGITELAVISSGQMIAIPVRCLRLAVTTPPPPSARQGPGRRQQWR